MGFKFNGRHSDDFRIGVITDSIPLIAPKRQTMVTIQGKDGQHVFEEGYDNVKITLSCAVGGYEIMDRRKKAREIAAWLSGTGPLVFDYENDIEYRVVKITNDIAAKILGRQFKDEFTIVFECEPYQEQTYYNDILSLTWEEQELQWQYANVPWNGYDRKFNNVVAGNTVDVVNAGTYKSLPVIVLTGQASSVTIGGFTYVNLSGTVYIDCKNMVVYSASGTSKINKLINFTGNFPVLLPEPVINSFLVSGSITTLNIEFFYKNTFL